MLYFLLPQNAQCAMATFAQLDLLNLLNLNIFQLTPVNLRGKYNMVLMCTKIAYLRISWICSGKNVSN